MVVTFNKSWSSINLVLYRKPYVVQEKWNLSTGVLSGLKYLCFHSSGPRICNNMKFVYSVQCTVYSCAAVYIQFTVGTSIHILSADKVMETTTIQCKTIDNRLNITFSLVANYNILVITMALIYEISNSVHVAYGWRKIGFWRETICGCSRFNQMP